MKETQGNSWVFPFHYFTVNLLEDGATGYQWDLVQDSRVTVANVATIPLFKDQNNVENSTHHKFYSLYLGDQNENFVLNFIHWRPHTGEIKAILRHLVKIDRIKVM